MVNFCQAAQRAAHDGAPALPPPGACGRVGPVVAVVPGVAGKHDYTVRFLPVGPEDEALGSPTQLGLFTKE